MAIKLSKRLQAIQNRINKEGSIICDVGCDHCYTAIAALKSHKAKFAYNIDINSNPLVSGIKNLEAEGVIKRTINFVNDGLKTDRIKRKLDYVIISGIGGNAIAEIIDNKNKNIKVINYICVANDHAEVVRKCAKKNKFKIMYEEIIHGTSSGKDYFFHLIQLSKKGIAISTEKDIMFGPYNLKHQSPEFIKLWTQRKDFILELPVKKPLIKKELLLIDSIIKK